jgi:uncharacterized repeat protein (TIGR03803 family)
MWREENMKRNQSQFWAAVSKALAVMTVTLIIALILAPGAAAGTYKILYNFTGGADGNQPEAAVILDTAGNLYGTTILGGAFGDGVVFEVIKNSDGTWTESVLHSFAGGTDGATPHSGLTFDASGNLYGTTQGGGTSSAGTVFELVPNSDGTWTESVLYSFTGGSDGASPWAGLIFDATGALYGTTYLGGASGLGVVYKLTPNSGGTWTESVLHTFTGGDNDGSNPRFGSLIFDTAGKLYGATTTGGGTTCYDGEPGCGAIFEMKPQSDGSWKEKVILNFNTYGLIHGEGVVFGPAGHLYGVAVGGYNSGVPNDLGAIFELTPGADGKWTERLLHEFHGNQSGAYPQVPIAFDAAGDIILATSDGYDPGGTCCGQVFKLIPSAHGWRKQALHIFQGPPQDGSTPYAGIVLDAAGNIYGTTCDAGSGGAGGNTCWIQSGSGVVYELTP